MDMNKTRLYELDHLGCAHCAAKIEAAVQSLPGIEEATLTFATKQLRVTAGNQSGLQERLQEICDHIEQGVIVRDLARNRADEEAGLAEEEEKGWTLWVGILIYGFTLFSGLIPERYELLFYGIAYLLFGFGIIRGAVNNIRHGQVFDEKFLMVLATAGAFAIGEYAEAAGVMLFSRVGEMMEDRAVEKSRRQIMEAVDLRPQTVRRISAGGTVEEIPAAQAAVHDILQIRPGDRIPLDGVVEQGESLIDTSALTGEPVPVLCRAGDELMSGGVNTSGLLRMRVTKILQDSMVSKILEAVESAAAKKPHLDRFITRFARIYTPIVVAVAAATALIPGAMTGQWEHWLYVALTFLVISCPCALVLSVPLSFFAGIGAASKKGILFKGGLAIEGLKRVRAVIFDKTGTVTKGDFTVKRVLPVASLTENQLLTWCASAEQGSLHPLARSVVAEAKARQLVLEQPEEVREIAGKGIAAVLGGRQLLCGSESLLAQYEVVLPAEDSEDYGSVLLLACDGVYAGRIVVADTVKDDALEAVGRIHALGLTTAMLTGDSQRAAEYIARQTGIDEVRARLLPQDKVAAMEGLRQTYGAVFFVGDGINDAPVLAGADVGAAMGSGADAAVEAADVVFLHSQMASVPQAFAVARETTQIAWQNIIFALTVKGLVMAAGFAGYASMWAAVFADTGVAALCVLNSIRILYKKI